MASKKRPAAKRTVPVHAPRLHLHELSLEAGLDPVELGKWLRDIREQVGITQFALAEKLGAHYQNLSRLETGRGEPKREPMITTIHGYLQALGWELVLVARPRGAKGSQ